MSASKTVDTRPLNINVGIMGHVDSGKTTLAKGLSHIKSTAAFDKHPQSQERGITIDLGFSSFKVSIPEHLKSDCEDKSELQFTLVDCPGHASLLRTVIGGSQIIDIILLVIDITKGIQTQTAECLVIAEITCKVMIVVLNKVDLIPKMKRDSTIEKVKKKIKITLEKTPFKDSPIVVTSAVSSASDRLLSGVDDLTDTLTKFVTLPHRHPEKPLVFAVDHCFSIQGQGTILTGTVIQGCVRINDTIEVPSLKLQKKIKSMQIFRRNIDYAEQGDRLGMCVKQLDPTQIERTMVCSPNYSSTLSAAIINISKIKYFKNDIKTGMKFHISIGYETVLGKVILFSATEAEEKNIEFDLTKEYLYTEKLFDENSDNHEENIKIGKQFALLEFEKPVISISDSLAIGSKLEIETGSSVCRLAFYGSVIYGFNEKNYSHCQLSILKVFKIKEKSGVIDRFVNEYELIGRNIFKKDSNIERFIGFKVQLSSGEIGIIDRSFGKSGKVVIRVPEGLKNDLANVACKITKKKSKQLNLKPGDDDDDGSDLINKDLLKFTMKFKKYCFDKDKKITQ